MRDAAPAVARQSGIELAASGDPGPGSYGFPAPVALPGKNVYAGNFLVVAAGGGMTPNYDGSRHRSFTPGLGVLGRLGPVSFSPRAAGLALDLVPPSSRKVTFALGPAVKYNVNRHSDIDDPVVAKLGKLSPWVDGGIAGSVSVRRLLTPYDSLSFSTDIRWDISGHGAGRIISPSIGYYTPINRGMLVTGSVFADFIDSKYANYNYAISQAGSLASGLPAYTAHAGPKDVGAQAGLVVDLDGNLLNGGLAALAGVSYSKLAGSAAQTPITALRGTVNQWSFGAGLAYSF